MLFPYGQDFAARFWAKVSLDSANRCWIWNGALNRDGYGQVGKPGVNTTLRAHRVAYQHLVGPIPEGMTIDHLCKVRNCVNPAHMEPVSQATNVRRTFHWQRRKTHCKHGHPFTPENTYVFPNGRRRCRECGRRWGAENDAKRRGRTRH